MWVRDGFLSRCHQSSLEGEELDLIKVSSGQHMQSVICIASFCVGHEVDLGELTSKNPPGRKRILIFVALIISACLLSSRMTRLVGIWKEIKTRYVSELICYECLYNTLSYAAD